MVEQLSEGMVLKPAVKPLKSAVVPINEATGGLAARGRAQRLSVTGREGPLTARRSPFRCCRRQGKPG